MNGKSAVVYFLNGFAINFINPFVFAVWIAFAAYLDKHSVNKHDLVLGLIACLAIIFATDCLKVIFATKISNYFKSKSMKLLIKTIGFGMVLFSFRLFYYLFQ